MWQQRRQLLLLPVTAAGLPVRDQSVYLAITKTHRTFISLEGQTFLPIKQESHPGGYTPQTWLKVPADEYHINTIPWGT
jgi:hypothetical protein